jgi:hypothetical protein
MVHATHVLLAASLFAVGMLVASARAASRPPSMKEPTILTTDDLEELASPNTPSDASLFYEDASADGSSSGAADGGGGLFANNKIHIRDSRIVLTASDRTQLLRSIARAMVADQKKAAAIPTANTTSTTPATTTSPLLPLTRDAFLYLAPSGAPPSQLVVRLGWRYPLATWHTYKALITTDSCGVQRVVGDFFYC